MTLHANSESACSWLHGLSHGFYTPKTTQKKKKNENVI